MHQKIILIGNLGGDPEMRYTPSGTAVTNFSVATKVTVSKERTPECPAGWKESYNKRAWDLTTWWRVTAWRGLAETCNQYLHKGSQVYVEGEIKGDAANGTQNPRVWTTDSGEARASFEMTARMVKFIGGRNGDSGSGQASASKEQEPAGWAPEEGDDIPF